MLSCPVDWNRLTSRQRECAKEYESLCDAIEREATEGGFVAFVNSPAARKELREQVKRLLNES